MTYEQMQQAIESGEATKQYYKPSESYEWVIDGQFYTRSGQELRDPSEFEPDEDGCYEPFGDE